MAMFKGKLNPFSLPSETNSLFYLLVASSFSLTYDLGLAAITFGLINSPPDTTPYYPSDSLLNERLKIAEIFRIIEYYIKLNSLQISLTIILIILAICVYYIYPKLIRQRNSLKKLNRENDPLLFDEIQNLAKLSGISPVPTIEIDSKSYTASGQVFGFRKPYSLKLGKSSQILLRQNAPEFRAIILHEFGHIKNKDVFSTYFVQSIWNVLVILILSFSILYVTSQIAGNNSSNILQTRIGISIIAVVQMTFFVLFISSIYSSFLRTRELYADWHVTERGEKISLAQILQRNKKPVKSYFTNPWQKHPDIEERLNYLDNSIRFFKSKSYIPFFVGMLLPNLLLSGATTLVGEFIILAGQISGVFIMATAFTPFSDIINTLIINASLLSWVLVSILVGALVGFGVSYLMAGTIGIYIQRQAIADIILGNNGALVYAKLWKIVAWVSIGFLGGMLIVPDSSFRWMLKSFQNNNLEAVSLNLCITTIIASFSIWLWLIFVRFFSKRILGTHVGFSPSKRGRFFLNFVISLAFLILFTPVIRAYFLVLEIADSGAINLSSQQLVSLTSFSLLALFGYFLLFFTVWLLNKIRTTITNAKCPHCRQKIKTRRKYYVGHICQNCQKQLTQWLYIEE